MEKRWWNEWWAEWIKALLVFAAGVLVGYYYGTHEEEGGYFEGVAAIKISTVTIERSNMSVKLKGVAPGNQEQQFTYATVAAAEAAFMFAWMPNTNVTWDANPSQTDTLTCLRDGVRTATTTAGGVANPILASYMEGSPTPAEATVCVTPGTVVAEPQACAVLPIAAAQEIREALECVSILTSMGGLPDTRAEFKVEAQPGKIAVVHKLEP